MKTRTALMLLALVLLALIAYRVSVPRQPMVSETMPESTHGTWVTIHPRYSDRYLKIDARSITFGTGGVVGKRFRVTGYNEEIEPDSGTVGTVYFIDADGSRYSRKFTCQTAGRGQFVFKNQPEVVWNRQR
jgi:hypothetical protein